MSHGDEITVDRILLVEDNPDHAMLASRALRIHFPQAAVVLAATAEEAEQLLSQGEWDAAVVDYSLPRANGLVVVEQVGRIRPHLPVVMLTGHGDERIAVAAMKAGAEDYVTKSGDYLALLPTSVESAIHHARVEADRERLAREREQYTRHLSAVNAVAVAVSRFLRLDEMLNEVVRQVAGIVEAPVAVFLPSEQGALRLSAHSGLSSWVVDRLEEGGLPLTLRDGSESVPLTEFALGLPGDCRLFALAADGEPQGFLAVIAADGEADGSQDETLASLARVIGMGVRNSLLFEETRALSLQDELTGLSNRRLFNIRLSGDFAMARRYGVRLALLMLDIDHFKRVNDRYGHAAGDVVLRGLSEVLLRGIRGADLAFRHGGEEFAVLLSHTELDAAACLGERICQAVANESFRVCDQAVRITVSIGVAAYSAQMEQEQDLVALADRALYRAKQSGRNRVCVLGTTE